MWIINCLLLMAGTFAAVLGVSFFIRSRKASGNIKIYIFLYGIFAAMWCISFGFIGFTPNLHACEIIRKVGDFGICGFLITEVFLVTEMSGMDKKLIKVLRLTDILLATVEYFFFSQNDVDTFIRRNGWTTWQANPAHNGTRLLHSIFILITFLILFFSGIAWARNTKLKRMRRFLGMIFFSNFLMLFFTLPDTFLPQLGIKAVSTSGLGAAVCASVIWYGATQLNSFDIRVGNIKDILFEFLDAGVIVFDMDRHIAILNQYSRDIVGEVGNRHIHLTDIFDINDEDREELLAVSVNDIYAKRFWNRKHTKAYSLRLSALKDDFGDPFCYMCVFVDVTEEVEAVIKYEIASRAKSRFLAQMSHEIRTPINAVLGMNEMILRESEDDEILEYASSIDSAGKTLLTLINSILDLSKIEDGKMDIIPVHYDTASFINDLYHSAIPLSDDKGLSLALEVDDRLPCTLIGDDVRFSQIIMNLLSNAIKYTNRGTVRLTIRAAAVHDEAVDIFVAVKDTGIGIKKEDMDRMFLSFERLDEVRNHNIEGTGLGLSIVSNLLNMMGSSLQVNSTYGEGSEFYFTISQKIADKTPIGNYEERLRESTGHRDTEDVIHAPGARILVVDDNDMNLKVARNMLKLCDIKPDLAVSGEEAVEYMKNSRYDIVFLDHMMPRMDGIETLHRMQEEKLVPEDTAMIALTANAVVGAREAYLKAGFKDYLSKPIEVKYLVEKLKTYLPAGAYEQTAGNDEAAAAADSPREASGGVKNNSEAGADGEIFEFVPEEDDGPDQGAAEAAEEAGGYDFKQLENGGIDTKAGMNYCAQDRELFFEMLKDFTLSCEERLRDTDRFLKEGSIKDYEIAVHALKSNARMLGANDAFEQLRQLEAAAKEKNTGFIEENHGTLKKELRRIEAVIKDAYRGKP